MLLDTLLDRHTPDDLLPGLGRDRDVPLRKLAGPRPGHARKRFRTVWISDVHLGTRGCRAERLLDFLRHMECETLYLVGDIVDAWALKKSWYWPESHTEVVRELLAIQHAGKTRVIYIPGNHDELLRDYLPLDFSGVEVRNEMVHQTADNRRFLVIHGDAFDAVCTEARWLAILGDYAYRAVIVGNSWFNTTRRRFGYPYWSLSAFLKHKVKNAVSFISNFEHALADEARRRGMDGVICGHIHCPRQGLIDGIEYCNDGDWVESCSALVEDANGALSILNWGRDDAQMGELAPCQQAIAA